jgi:predicted ATPase
MAQIGTRTPVLSHDGADLAAALQTIREIGDAEALDDAVRCAFPGSHVEITAPGGRFELALRQPGLLRPLRAAELSDGTLRYLLWAAALLTPRPPEMLVLNEPEALARPLKERAGARGLRTMPRCQSRTPTRAGVPRPRLQHNSHPSRLVRETSLVGAAGLSCG